MAVSIEDTGALSTRTTGREALEYRLVYLIGFSAFLGAALIGRLLPWRWRILGGTGGNGRSVFAEARMRADGTVPFAFMR